MQLTAANPIRLAIADDHSLILDGFETLLRKQTDIRIAGVATNGKELVTVIRKERPDIVITDIQMPVMDGIEATAIITKEFPQTGVIALSMFGDSHLLLDMIKAGARGYLLKNTNRAEVVQAIKAVYNKGTYYCEHSTRTILQLMEQKKEKGEEAKDLLLSERERNIIQYICREFSNKQIAEELHITCRSVESCRERLQEKIGAKNMVGIALYAIKHGIVKISG